MENNVQFYKMLSNQNPDFVPTILGLKANEKGRGRALPFSSHAVCF